MISYGFSDHFETIKGQFKYSNFSSDNALGADKLGLANFTYADIQSGSLANSSMTASSPLWHCWEIIKP